MKRILWISAVCALAVAPAFAGMTTYTSEAIFVSQLQTGYYLEDWDRAPWTTIVDPAITSPQSFSGGAGWAYQISSPSGLSGQPIPPPNGPGGAVAPYYQGQAVTITFQGSLPEAIGGIFFSTDLTGNPIPNAVVTIKLVSGDTFTYSDTSNWDDFTGFISDSPIRSMSLQTDYFATMDHLYVGNPVPLPASVLLGVFAVGWAGRKLRKFV